MNKLYNTQEEIASAIVDFLKNVGILKKTQLNIIPYIIIGMFLSESIVSSDIAKKLKDKFSFIQHDSIIRRIQRFFNNKIFNIYHFYDLIIKYVTKNFNIKHLDKKIFISFDHMYCKDHFTVLMFTLRIGKQSVPLWFRCFLGKKDPNAFSEELFIKGIDYCINLFKHLNPKIIFLADRFFNSATLLNYIESRNCYYCVRIKTNMYVLVYDKKEGHPIWKEVSELKHYVYHSCTYKNIIYTREHKFTTTIVISKSKDLDEPWFIATNLNPKDAIKSYGKRFGATRVFL